MRERSIMGLLSSYLHILTDASWWHKNAVSADLHADYGPGAHPADAAREPDNSIKEPKRGYPRSIGIRVYIYSLSYKDSVARFYEDYSIIFLKPISIVILDITYSYYNNIYS